MNCLGCCFLRLCMDGDVEVPPPTQRRIPHNPQGQTAPYLQQAQYQERQLRSQYPTEFQRREYGHLSPSPSRAKNPLPPSKSPIHHHHQKENDHQPSARPRTAWPGPDNFQRKSSPWEDAIPQDSYDELPETDFKPSSTPPPLYHRYPPKQGEHHMFPKPSAVSRPATGRRNVPTYYFSNSPNVVTLWRPPPPPRPPPPQPEPVPHYENLNAVEDWIWAVEEETEREEQVGQKEEETGHQDPRIVSGVSSLSYYSETGLQHRRPVSAVSSVSSYYSEQRESRALTPIPGVRKWGNAKYEDARREESNWL